MPFSWQGVSLHAAGASAVRVRIAPVGRRSRCRIELADGLGLPVLSVGAMVARPVSRAAAAGGGGGLGPGPSCSRWCGRRRRQPRPIGANPAPSYELLESVAAEHDPVTGSLRSATHQALAAVQSWLAERDSGVLVVATRGAVALAGEDVTDLAGAAVWGLVRSAQTEHPGRIVLVDSDTSLDGRSGSRGARGRRAAGRAPRRSGLRRAGARAAAQSMLLLAPPGDVPWRLGISECGHVRESALEPVPNADAPLEPGQVRVALHAVGGELPRRHDHPRHVHPRRRCSAARAPAWSSRSVPDVTGFAVGDRVMGLFPEGTGTLVAGRRPPAAPDARRTGRTPRPPRCSVVFTTAYYRPSCELADGQAGPVEC